MSQLFVDNIKGRTGGAIGAPSGVNATGVVTATTFKGTSGEFTGNVSVGGTLTYEDVSNVDAVGVITARDGIRVGAGESISAVSGTIYYYGDGSNLDGVVSGVETKEEELLKEQNRLHSILLVQQLQHQVLKPQLLFLLASVQQHHHQQQILLSHWI